MDASISEKNLERGSSKCPVGMDLAALGKKWTYHIMRDIGILEINRFNRILKSLPGLTPRVLIMRLNELESCGLIRSIVLKERPRLIEWVLTEKGADTIPILQGYSSYVAKWHPDASLKNHFARSLRLPTLSELIRSEGKPNAQNNQEKAVSPLNG